MKATKATVPWVEIGQPRWTFRQRDGEPMALIELAGWHMTAAAAGSLAVWLVTGDVTLMFCVMVVLYAVCDRVTIIMDWVREVRYRRAADRRMLAALNRPCDRDRMAVRPRG